MQTPPFLMPKPKDVLHAVHRVREERRVPTLEIPKVLGILDAIDQAFENESVTIADVFTAALLAAVPGTSRVDITERAAYRATVELLVDIRELSKLHTKH